MVLTTWSVPVVPEKDDYFNRIPLSEEAQLTDELKQRRMTPEAFCEGCRYCTSDNNHACRAWRFWAVAKLEGRKP